MVFLSYDHNYEAVVGHFTVDLDGEGNQRARVSVD